MMRGRRFRRGINYRETSFRRKEGGNEPGTCCEVDIGHCLRILREGCGLSLRALADKSRLSVNTLSLIENGKSSPSVGTLQKISLALQVPIVAFFPSDQVEQKVIFTKNGRRKQVAFEHGKLEDLSEGISDGGFEPFIVTLDPHANSGPDPMTHAGYEFVFCLKGRIAYVIEDQHYILDQGDSLFFESHLLHCWQNLAAEPSLKILILCPTDEGDLPADRHFS
jgi:transcriptional regulator with XRE-family HTH domain